MPLAWLGLAFLFQAVDAFSRATHAGDPHSSHSIAILGCMVMYFVTNSQVNKVEGSKSSLATAITDAAKPDAGGHGK